MMKYNSKHLKIIGIIALTVSFIFAYYSDIINQGSLVMANTLEDMKYYLGESEEIERYNEAIFASKQGDYLVAESLISPLINREHLTASGDIYELYGDILYSLGKPQDVVLVYYSRSLEYNNSNLRVEKKISLLKDSKLTASGSQESSSQSGITNTPQYDSGTLEKTEKLNELNTIGAKRGEYLRYDSILESNKEFLIRSSIDTLAGKKEQRDW
ncbi:hypothetical protein KBD33_03360 [Candidatus Gracilibacteria bacterium]|nr:hypothetical protein [Candidatus Gracilibacteria bacterium]